jgi:hypothetical protein
MTTCAFVTGRVCKKHACSLVNRSPVLYTLLSCCSQSISPACKKLKCAIQNVQGRKNIYLKMKNMERVLVRSMYFRAFIFFSVLGILEFFCVPILTIIYTVKTEYSEYRLNVLRELYYHSEILLLSVYATVLVFTEIHFNLKSAKIYLNALVSP